MMPQVRKGMLDVYLLGRLVGRIDYTSHHNEMRFAYDAEYLLRSDAAPLSFSLPLFGTPSTHILKSAVVDYPDTIYKGQRLLMYENRRKRTRALK